MSFINSEYNSKINMLLLSTDQDQRRDSRYKPVIFMALITAVSLFGDSKLYIALPIHWREAGLTSLVEVGILLSANRYIRLPLNPLISWLFTKLSIRNGLIIAVIIAGSTTFLYGWAQSFLYWLILRCIWGVAWSIIRLGAYFMIFDSSTNENRGHLTMRTKLTVSALSKQPQLVWMLLTVFIVMLCLEGMITASLSHLIDVRIQVDISIYGMLFGAAAIAACLQASRLVIGAFIFPWVGRNNDDKWGRGAVLSVTLLLASFLISVVQLNRTSH